MSVFYLAVYGKHYVTLNVVCPRGKQLIKRSILSLVVACTVAEHAEVQAIGDFDEFEQEIVMIRNSSDGQYHLWAEIVTPVVDVPQQTVDALVELFESFHVYMR